MRPSQTRAVEAIRAMILRAAFLDLKTEWENGARRRVPEEEVAGSSYEFAEWSVREDGHGGLFVYATVRKRAVDTLGHLFPRHFHFHVGPLGGMKELSGARAGGRRVGLRDYAMGR